jgi:membrane protein required for beta-lactamase induction
LGAMLVWLIPLVASVAFMQYRLWVADGRWRKIAQENPRESPSLRRFRSILIWCYVGVTAAMVPVVGILLHRALPSAAGH